MEEGDMHDDKIKKIFDSIDRISRKLDYIAKSLEVFDPPRVYNGKGGKTK